MPRVQGDRQDGHLRSHPGAHCRPTEPLRSRSQVPGLALGSTRASQRQRRRAGRALHELVDVLDPCRAREAALMDQSRVFATSSDEARARSALEKFVTTNWGSVRFEFKDIFRRISTSLNSIRSLRLRESERSGGIPSLEGSWEARSSKRTDGLRACPRQRPGHCT